MKKLFYLLLLVLGTSVAASAAPGDTTWVSSHNGTWLSYYGNYDTGVVFPSGTTSYRKVYMIFTLGKYSCPGNPQYCADWDYTVQNFVMTPTDTFELGRLITPYARGNGMGANWTFRYVFDVTDFYPYLKGNARMRTLFSGYSGGFTGKIDFAFIEGTPERTVLKVDRLWHGSYAYGKTSDPIEDHFAQQSRTAPTGTQSAELKFTVTGHGSDPNYCSEFCKKYYQVLVNGTQVAQKDIWRDDCGFNEVSAQNGTWIYDRGNWCPGALVHVNSHPLTGVAAGGNYNVNLDFEPYSSNGSASYTTDAVVVYYGATSNTLDASVEGIMQPTDHEAYKRSNPMCGQPKIIVHNSGSTPITSLKLEHGVEGKYLPTYYWQGTIAPMETKEIVLPEPWELRIATGANVYKAHILEVNGQTGDGDATNNTAKSSFNGVARWPLNIVLTMKTNNRGSENAWKVYDVNNNIVAQRQGSVAQTIYVDTLRLGPGCYRLEMSDEGCDGLAWWANPNAGTGFFRAQSMENPPSNISLPNYLGADFGCGFTQYFRADFPLSASSVNATGGAALDAYPNPASSGLTINLSGMKSVTGTMTLTDATGRTVWQESVSNAQNQLSLEAFSSGVYQLNYRSADGATSLHTRVVIAR